MHKALKITLVAVGGLAMLAAGALAVVVATFDPNDYKPLLIARVQQDKQRTLAIPGPVKLSLFPSLGVQTGAVSLSERQSSTVFASMQSARVSLALWPLLRRQLVIDRVTLDGLQAQVTRFADGHTSIDDLLGGPKNGSAPAEAPGQALAFDVAGVSITNAQLAFDDRQAGRRFELQRASVQTGRLAPGTASDVALKARIKSSAPVVDADLALEGQLLLDPAARHYAFRKLDARLSGQALTLLDAEVHLSGQADVVLEPLRADVAGLALSVQGRQGDARVGAEAQAERLRIGEKDIQARKLTLAASRQQGTRTLKAQLALPDFQGSLPAFQVPALSGEATLNDGALQARARLSGTLEGHLDRQLFAAPQFNLVLDGQQGSTPVSGTLALPWQADLKGGTVSWPKIVLDATLPNPRGGPLALKAQGSATLKLQAASLEARLAGLLDQSRFSASLTMPRLAPAAYRFDAEVDQIDADRYRAAAPAGPGAGPAPGAPAAPIDVSPLRELDLAGTLRVGSLKVANLKLSQLRVGVKAAGGMLDLNPLQASLYQGTVNGRASVLAAPKAPQFRVEQTLAGISVGPLLADLTGKESLQGRGNVTLDLTSVGGTPAALMKALAGSARLELRDGAVKGINIAQAVRGARSSLGLGGGTSQGSGSSDQATDFSELSGSFRIAAGVAHNDDLQAKSPLLRVAGNGDIDLGESRLDYRVQATVVGTLQGQGGPELQALRGQTVPVHLKGPFSNIGYSVDFASVARQKVEDAVAKRLGVQGNDAAARDDARKKLGDKLKGLLGGR